MVLVACCLPGRVLAAGLLKAVNGGDVPTVIKSHKVDVAINNGFARTEVEQVFVNSGDIDLEAVYTFPLPKQSSLSEVSLWIDEAEVVGEVVEKERAREIYQEQKAQGNQTALAEKDDYKTFDISIGKIPAGGETRVRLVYYQPMEIDLNIGRYLYPLQEGNVDEERIAFWSVDDRVEGQFSFRLQLKSAFPIKDVRVPNFQNDAVVRRLGGDGEGAGEVWDVVIDKPAGGSLGQDIVFYYRLDDSVPARVELIPFRADPGEPGTFMVVVTPAADLQPISEGTDWVFVLDVSGSMNGQKIATLADGVARTLTTMPVNDRFRVVTFNNSARDLTGGFVQATPENVRGWIERIKMVQAGGGTNLFEGLALGYRKLDDDRTTGMVLVTDGVANVGPTGHARFLELLRDNDLRLFTFVIGNSANQPLMDRLAKESGGFAMNISNADDIIGRILQAKAKVSHECLHDVRLSFSGEKVRDLTPAKTGSLYLGQQLVMFGRYTGHGEVKLSLKAKISGQERSWQTTALLPEVATDNPELERLWALSRIDELMQEIREKGEGEDSRRQVVELGTGYSLVTDYTSMIVARDEVFENEGIQRINADRVARERRAQAVRANAPVQSHRVDKEKGGGMFRGLPSPGIGSGPVGPLFVGLAAWLARRRKRLK
ncbi:MAG: VWA domain-containing protein [Desulfuromonas sp.]|nr:MAG: VWA domain-containing protein [Desulfuromonas sp.]